MPLDDGLVSQTGGCGGIGGSEVGLPAKAVAFPFPANVPAPTGTGILFACGGNMPGPETGLYGGYDAALGLPGSP